VLLLFSLRNSLEVSGAAANVWYSISDNYPNCVAYFEHFGIRTKIFIRFVHHSYRGFFRNVFYRADYTFACCPYQDAKSTK